MSGKLRSCYVFCVLFLSICINGCSLNKDLSHKYSKDFIEQRKAVVSIKISNPYKDLFNRTHEGIVSFRLIELNDNYNDQDKRHSYFMAGGGNDLLFGGGNYKFSLAMINPGIYYIDDISWDDGLFHYYSVAPGISKTGMISYGAFKIKLGEVGYVGKLIIKDRTINLEKINELEKVKNDLLKDKQNDLSEKVKDIEFYGRGSMVRRDNNGIFTLHKAKHENSAYYGAPQQN